MRLHQKKPVDSSKFQIYQMIDAFGPRVSPLAPRRRRSRLSFRCPQEIWQANGFTLEVNGPCPGHNHKQVVINGLEICPISAILFLMSARDYYLTDALNEAINKILEVANVQSSE